MRAFRHIAATAMIVASAAPAAATQPVATQPLATIEIVNARGEIVAFRAGSGFQGRFETPLPERLAPGESARAELRAGFPDSQGGGFRYGAQGGAECDFGFLRLRGPSGIWSPPTVRAGGAHCRAEIVAATVDGAFTARFTLE